MNIALWIEEGFEEGETEMLKDAEKKKKKTVSECACGRAVCCGKHKNGQRSSQRAKERD